MSEVLYPVALKTKALGNVMKAFLFSEKSRHAFRIRKDWSLCALRLKAH